MITAPCPECGYANDNLANFCASCGCRVAGGVEQPTASLPVVEHPDQPDRDHLAERAAFDEAVGLLVVHRGPKAGSRYALDSPLIRAGRDPESDIFLDDVTVSRSHVEISHLDGVYSVCDVGSLNGTYVNKERIEKSRLIDGDELQIGRFKLQFFHGTSHA